MARVGILGGTFDPIHNGHIQLALKTLEFFCLDYVYLIPSGNSYMKKGVTGTGCRFDMVSMAVAEFSVLKVSDIEVNRKGNSYTYETLNELSQNGDELYYIIGADTLFMIDKWRKPEEIFKRSTIIVANRNEYSGSDLQNQANLLINKYNAKIEVIPLDKINISSTIVRKELASDKKVDSLLPKEVCMYIYQHHLYGYKQNELCTSILKVLKQELKPKRFEHTLNVTKMAMHLASVYDEDVCKAQIAGLLHDCTKSLSYDENVVVCRENGLVLSDIELKVPELLHSKSGSIIARLKYNIVDDLILDAIRWHTTCRPNMTMLDKILVASDFLEPNRDFSEQLPMLRVLVETDIDMAIYLLLKEELNYFEENNVDVDNTTRESMHYLKKEIDKRKGERS